MKKITVDNWIEITLFIISISIYTCTSSRTVIQGDTGEFLAVAAIRGVPHDPGYPLYSLVVYLVYLVSHSIWVVNLTSAVFGALALVFTFRIVKLITYSIPAAVYAALALGTYEHFFLYALVAQVHVLQVFLESVLFYLLVLAFKRKSLKFLYFASFVFGLAVTNHQTTIFLLPGFLLAILHVKSQIKINNLIIMAFISILGLVPYMYIIWASPMNPPVNWGRVHDLTSFLYLFFRRDYGTVLLSKPEPGAPFIYSSFFYFFTNIFYTSWFILPFAVISLVYLFKKNNYYTMLFYPFLLIGPFYYLIMHTAMRSIVHRVVVEQYIPYAFIFIAIFSGMGLYVISDKYKIKNIILYSLIVITFVPVLFFTAQKVRFDNKNIVEMTVRQELSDIPENGILLTWSDSIYLPLQYLQYAKNYRTDIIVIQLGMTNLDWYQQEMKQQYPQYADLLLPSNFDYIKACNIYAKQGKLFIHPWYQEFDESFQGKCKIVPHGLISEVVPTDKIISIENVKKYNDMKWQTLSSLLPLSTYKNSSTRTKETLFYLSEHQNYIGIYYLNSGKEKWALSQFKLASELSPDQTNSMINESIIYYNKGDYSKALSILEEGNKINPVNLTFYKNIGLIYFKLNQQDKAYSYLKHYLDFNPEDKDIITISSIVSSYEMKKNFGK